MAVVRRYFSTTAAGAGDGTTWADRAALLVSGEYNAIITGFDFGVDALECYIGPGTYSRTQTINAALFSVTAPSRANGLILVACDASGDLWVPPDPQWTAAQPAWDSAGMPYFDDQSGVFCTVAGVMLRGLRVESWHGTGVIGNVGSAAVYSEWCIFTATGSASGVIGARGNLRNCVVRCTGSQYQCLVLHESGSNALGPHNVRAEGNPAASSGLRHGIQSASGNLATPSRCVVIGTAGGGIAHTNTGASAALACSGCIAYQCDGNGFATASTSVSNAQHMLIGCMAIGCGGYGVDMGQGPTVIRNSRFRANTSGAYSSATLANGWDDGSNIVAAGDDSDEFVDAAGGDLRIKHGSDLWGKGIGAGDEPAPAPTGGGTRGYWG